MVQEWQFQQSVEAIVFACAWKKQNVGLNPDADVHMDFPFFVRCFGMSLAPSTKLHVVFPCIANGAFSGAKAS